jgi:hypothetical protein
VSDGGDHRFAADIIRLRVDKAARARGQITGGEGFCITGIAVTEIAAEVVNIPTLLMTAGVISADRYGAFFLPVAPVDSSAG